MIHENNISELYYTESTIWGKSPNPSLLQFSISEVAIEIFNLNHQVTKAMNDLIGWVNFNKIYSTQIVF